MSGFISRLKDFFLLKKSISKLSETEKEKELKVNNLEKQLEQLDFIVNSKIEQEREILRLNMMKERQVLLDEAIKEKVRIQNECDNLKGNYENTFVELMSKEKNILSELLQKTEEKEQLLKDVKKLTILINKGKVESIAIKNIISLFPRAVDYSVIGAELQQFEAALNDEGILDTVVHLDLQYKKSRQLRSQMNSNNKEIQKLITSYQSRYTTKANITIYDLMVIGLQAEMQNILYTLTYTNLDEAIDRSKKLIEKYLQIASNGNAQLIGTITKFLMELEVLFEQAIRIEYAYYIQREKEKEEQRRIREQMKQEAEERKLLEEERKKIEKEEEKFIAELNRNKELLSAETNITKIEELEARIALLESQYNELEKQKEEIVKRANGKAGHVYVISNLGSFGDQMFKIGMTRRLDPLERIDELGDASVPFKFDIHALIFSNDAVTLEQQIHQKLDIHRVNKINLRKEYFYSTTGELEELVQQLDPTAEFTTTMIAQEYRQSLAVIQEKESSEYIVVEEEVS